MRHLSKIYRCVVLRDVGFDELHVSSGKLQKKLRTCKLFAFEDGETLVETLISTLIISAVVLMLATAVVTAARVNTAISAEDTAFNVSDDNIEKADSVTLTIDIDDASISQQVSGNLEGYYTDNGYVYYTYKR